MKYAKARPEIKTGDLLAWSHGGWSSWPVMTDAREDDETMSDTFEYAEISLNAKEIV